MSILPFIPGLLHGDEDDEGEPHGDDVANSDAGLSERCTDLAIQGAAGHITEKLAEVASETVARREPKRVPCFKSVVWDDPSCVGCPHHYNNFPQKTRREWNRELSKSR